MMIMERGTLKTHNPEQEVFGKGNIWEHDKIEKGDFWKATIWKRQL